MARTDFIEHKGRKIVFMNFAGVHNTGEALMVIEEARAFVASQPRRRDLLVLTDVTGSIQDSRVVDGLKALAAHDTPWVLASAVVGLSPLKRIVFKLIVLFSGRKLATFNTDEEAKEWLALQWVPPITVPDAAA